MPGTMLKGRSVTRWSRGRHLRNKRLLHKITTWVIAFLSSPRAKSSGKRAGNSLVGSLSVCLSAVQEFMGWRRHPKNLPLCAGKLNSLLFFRIHKSASFFSKCCNFKLNTMQIFNFGQKSLKLASDQGLASSCFCRYRSNVYVHEWLFVCLCIYYGNLFIMNVDICVPWF